MNFTALDVETANAHLASVCQIGVVRFSNGQLADKWESLVDPEDYFSGINISIHGIDKDTVAGAPTFPDLSSVLCDCLVGPVVVSHTPFDRIAIGAVFTKYGIDAPKITLLDSARYAADYRHKSGLACLELAAENIT